MLLQKFSNVKLNNSNKKYFINLGYNCDNENIIVNAFDLSKGSHTKVKVKCDVCGTEKHITYKDYNKNIKKYSLYACSSKCARIKAKQTCLKNFVLKIHHNQRLLEKRLRILVLKHK